MPTSVKTAYGRSIVRLDSYISSLISTHWLYIGGAYVFYLMAFRTTSTFASFTVDVDTDLGGQWQSRAANGLGERWLSMFCISGVVS